MAKKPVSPAASQPSPDELHPQNPSEFVRRGWLYYADGAYAKAESDFRTVLESRPDDVDVLFALGLTLKNLGRQEASVKVFEQVIVQAERIEDRVRSRMIIRLAKGHINEIDRGDWNLEG